MTEVILHVYDVTNSESSKTNNTIVNINKFFKDGIGLGGIFHSAIEKLRRRKEFLLRYMGFSSSASVVIGGLVDNYSKARDMVSAKKCFEEFLIVDTVQGTLPIEDLIMMDGWMDVINKSKRR